MRDCLGYTIPMVEKNEYCRGRLTGAGFLRYKAPHVHTLVRSVSFTVLRFREASR